MGVNFGNVEAGTGVDQFCLSRWKASLLSLSSVVHGISWETLHTVPAPDLTALIDGTAFITGCSEVKAVEIHLCQICLLNQVQLGTCFRQDWRGLVPSWSPTSRELRLSRLTLIYALFSKLMWNYQMEDTLLKGFSEHLTGWDKWPPEAATLKGRSLETR